jgi:hypothetical protein
MRLAFKWLYDNPTETLITAARIYKIKKDDSVRKAWLLARIKLEKGKAVHRS